MSLWPCTGSRSSRSGSSDLFLLHPSRLKWVMMLKCQWEARGQDRGFKLVVKAGRRERWACILSSREPWAAAPGWCQWLREGTAMAPFLGNDLCTPQLGGGQWAVKHHHVRVVPGLLLESWVPSLDRKCTALSSTWHHIPKLKSLFLSFLPPAAFSHGLIKARWALEEQQLGPKWLCRGQGCYVQVEWEHRGHN